MKSLLVLCLTLFALATRAFAQADDAQRETFVFETNLPDELQAFYKQEKIRGIYLLRTDVNPFYLRGDFNGDKKQDYAMGVVERKTNKKGILICHSGSKAYFVIGAGSSFNGKRDDLSWMDAWKVSTDTDIEMGVGETTKIVPKGELILVIKTEASSGLIYWTGKDYKWYQQGD